jgi:hypothetical protein
VAHVAVSAFATALLPRAFAMKRVAMSLYSFSSYVTMGVLSILVSVG